jgi:two-component system, sensor histidine kinase YesM
MRNLKLKNIGIARLLLFTYLVIIIPPFIIQLFMNSNLVGTYKQGLIDSNIQYINETITNMEYNLKDLVTMSFTIYSNNDVLNILSHPTDDEEYEKYQNYIHFQNYLKTIAYRSIIAGVYIYRTTGEYFYVNCNNGQFNINETLQNGKWLHTIKPAANEFSFLGTHRPGQLLGGDPVLSIARNVIDPDNKKYLGLMLIDVKPEKIFFSTGSESADTPTRKLIVADERKNIIFHHDLKLMMTKLSDDAFSSVFSNQKGYFIYLEGKVKYLVSYNTSKITGWKVITITPLIDVIKSADSIKYSLILTTIVLTLFAILVSIISSLYISSPLRKFIKKMEAIEKGNLDVSCDLKGTKEISILGSGFNAMITRIKDMLKNEFELKLLKKDAEFKALQAQINPHFLYNTLESISALAEFKKAPEVGITCRVLSNMFRYSIGTKNNNTTLQREIEHVTDYISIIKLRFEDRVDFHICIEDDLEHCEILKLVLQPLVENSINHGFADLAVKGIVTLNITENNGDIVIQVQDNGKGMSHERKEEVFNHLKTIDYSNIREIWQDSSESIGLRNIHLRLSSYYGSKYGITAIESDPGNGTTILLKIPVVKIQGRLFHV